MTLIPEKRDKFPHTICIVVSGPIGTGKTTMLQELKDYLKQYSYTGHKFQAAEDFGSNHIESLTLVRE